MTVTIKASQPGGDLRALAEAAVDNELRARSGYKGYDSDLRQQAIEAILDYQPSYIRLSDYGDQLSTNAAIWAMGGKLGVPSLDPIVALRGLRQVMRHFETLWPEQADLKIRKVLRNLRPMNAMAQLDRELLLVERGISEKEVDWSDEAARERAAK